MFGISPLGWVHTLSSLPAIPAALYMLATRGRITPQTRPGAIYFICMLIGALTVFLVAHQQISYVIGIATLVFLLAGYGVGRLTVLGGARRYIETICLSLTVFLLMVPAVSETLRRVPDGHPFVTSLDAPLLIGVQALLFVALVVGLSVQLVVIWRQNRAG